MWEVKFIVFDKFKLDGGAMFGVIPKPLWSKLCESDDLNRINLVTRCLVLEGKGKKVLIDCGCGDKWDQKNRQIYQIENLYPSFDYNSVTDVLITHLHFDHCGGLTKAVDSCLISSFPRARIWISKKNYELAKEPNEREKASYLPENFDPVDDQVSLLDSEGEVFDGIRVRFSNGHTTGMAWFELNTDMGKLVYPSDLMPTFAHKKLVYTMGYDMCTATLLEEKKELIELIKSLKAKVVFEHDALVELANFEEF
ncbi:MAG: MBL fold metallo-hydrolase [Deltaproteobacteria bacterium]|nr:MBL fold metallo-hydrolase [Deltaproteobacteria bacterium]